MAEMRRISEAEANRLGQDFDCPVVAKAESEPMEAAVCLKRLREGFLLGVSDVTDELRLWYLDDEALARHHYDRLVGIMHTHGTPLRDE